MTNMLSSLKNKSDAAAKCSTNEAMASLTDVAEAFDRKQHKNLVRKTRQLVLGGCGLELSFDYLNSPEQFFTMDNKSSRNDR